MDNTFIVIQWPEIQEYMTFKDFDKNACLINNSPFLGEYGNQAYFVRQSWLEEIY